MKHVIFNSVKIQNFLSVGEEPLELNFNSGITVITGENRDKGGRNGVGKSTVVESLYWGLFGSTIRELKREKIIHNQSSKGCCVTLNFDIINGDKKNCYILSRYIEPNKVLLSCNGEDITRSSMPKTDELIKELIGGSEEVFQNAVIMTANNTTPFMAQKKVDKRKFVEGILRLGIFGEMLLQIRQDFNDFKKQNDVLSSSFFDKQKNLDLYKIQFNKSEENKSQKISNLSEKIENNLIKIKEISKTESVEEEKKNITFQIENKEEKIKKLNILQKECEEESKDLWKYSQELNFEINQAEKELTNLKKTETFCPTCKRDYENLDKNHLCSLQENLQFKLEDLNSKHKESVKKNNIQSKNCTKISEAIEQLKENLDQLQKNKEFLNLAAQQIQNLNDRNVELNKEILELKDIPNEFDSLLKNVSEEIVKTENELTAIQKKITILEACKYVVSEEGVKTFIIKKILNLLNSKLNFYLQALEAPCKCEFNEMFEETIYDDQGKECSYFNFSGGERKRIDLAILFMFQDLLRIQNGTRFSLSIYDELFDSAIDEKGVSKILEILKDRVENYQENIYIISHNKASINSGISQFILLEKHNGKTKIVQ